MNKDRLFKIIFALVILLAILFFSVGKWTFSGIAVLVAAAMYMNAGGGDFNSRNLYEKKVENQKGWTLDQLYRMLTDMNTPLGRCWVGSRKESQEPCIVFGPAPFKDYILITVNEKEIGLVSGTEVEHLVYPESEAWRFQEIIDTENLEVTPKRYSAFAGDKVITAVLMSDLADQISNLMKDASPLPEELDMFTLYHYNSHDTTVRDLEENCYARTSTAFDPLSIVIYDMDGNETAKVTGDLKNRAAGFKVQIGEEDYGTIYCDKNSKQDAYYLEGADGMFRLESFRAVRRANVGMNYTLTLDGEIKAVLASSPRIRFTSTGLIENDVICSFDNEYLLWYLIIQETVTALNGFVK